MGGTIQVDGDKAIAMFLEFIHFGTLGRTGYTGFRADRINCDWLRKMTNICTSDFEDLRIGPILRGFHKTRGRVDEL